MSVRAVLLTLGLGALVCVAAGCDGGRSPGVAQVGTTTTTSTSSASAASTSGGPPGPNSATRAAFIACMQKHGVPISSGGSISIPGGLSSPTVQKAQAACQKFFGPPPLSAAQQIVQNKELLALAACMRSHGYPGFPDPTSQGVFDLPATYASVQNSPQFQAAMNTCQPQNSSSVPLQIRIHTS
jgi:hypothetical protein